MTDSLARIVEEYFTPALALLCFVYLGIEFVYIARLPFVMDEFQGASEVYRLMSEIPYVDFKPYKTVLGYYLQLPPMLLSDDPWRQMMLVKQAMALATAGSIFLAARMLLRHFSSLSVFLATLMLVLMSTFLERSASLRVDMLTSLFGLFGLICLLDRRVLAAGVLAGLSFLVSQKGRLLHSLRRIRARNALAFPATTTQRVHRMSPLRCRRTRAGGPLLLVLGGLGFCRDRYA